MIDVDYNEYKKTLTENMKLIVENNRLKEVEEEQKEEIKQFDIEYLKELKKQAENELLGGINDLFS